MYMRRKNQNGGNRNGYNPLSKYLVIYFLLCNPLIVLHNQKNKTESESKKLLKVKTNETNYISRLI